MLMRAALFVLPLAACGYHSAQATPASPSAEELGKAVSGDCLVDRGTLRKIGGLIGVRPVPGKVIRMSKAECDARRGQWMPRQAAADVSGDPSSSHLANDARSQDK